MAEQDTLMECNQMLQYLDPISQTADMISS